MAQQNICKRAGIETSWNPLSCTSSPRLQPSDCLRSCKIIYPYDRTWHRIYQQWPPDPPVAPPTTTHETPQKSQTWDSNKQHMSKIITETITQKLTWTLTDLICEIWCSFLSFRSSDCRENRLQYWPSTSLQNIHMIQTDTCWNLYKSFDLLLKFSCSSSACRLSTKLSLCRKWVIWQWGKGSQSRWILPGQRPEKGGIHRHDKWAN